MVHAFQVYYGKGMDVARPEVDYGRQQKNLLIRGRRVQEREREKGGKWGKRGRE